MLPIIIIFIVFIVLYSVAPNVKTKLKSVLPGAVFTSIIWLAGSFGFGWYISNLVTILKHMAVSRNDSFCYYGYISQVLL